MSYINTIDINGVVYNLGSLTDGNHEVNLPQNLKNNDVSYCKEMLLVIWLHSQICHLLQVKAKHLMTKLVN